MHRTGMTDLPSTALQRAGHRSRPRLWRAALGASAALLWLSGCAGLSLFGPEPTPQPALSAPLKWGDPPRGSAPPADSAYRIGAEDTLEIAVWRDDSLKSTVVVRPDGGISFPLVGEVAVAGKTTAEVRQDLATRLDKFVPDPVVTVAVQRVASYRIYVLGRVNKPGDFVLGRTIDVLQALSLAGGMTPFAAEDDIRIIRRIAGQSVAIPFQYSKVRKGADLSQNISLQSGDVLVVP